MASRMLHAVIDGATTSSYAGCPPENIENINITKCEILKINNYEKCLYFCAIIGF